ncbi:unnamed protein product [Gadus morhua 'NCC']
MALGSDRGDAQTEPSTMSSAHRHTDVATARRSTSASSAGIDKLVGVPLLPKGKKASSSSYSSSLAWQLVSH